MIYTYHFRKWIEHTCGGNTPSPMPAFLITALEMMRQRSVSRSVRLYVHDPRCVTHWWIRQYIHWLDTRIMPGSTPLILQNDLRDRRTLRRAYPTLHFASLRYPDKVRGMSARIVAVLGADRTSSRPDRADNFWRAKRALLPMLDTCGTIAIFVGNANRTSRSFAGDYIHFRDQIDGAAFWTYDATRPERILPRLLALTRHPDITALAARAERLSPPPPKKRKPRRAPHPSDLPAPYTEEETEALILAYKRTPLGRSYFPCLPPQKVPSAPSPPSTPKAPPLGCGASVDAHPRRARRAKCLKGIPCVAGCMMSERHNAPGFRFPVAKCLKDTLFNISLVPNLQAQTKIPA